MDKLVAAHTIDVETGRFTQEYHVGSKLCGIAGLKTQLVCFQIVGSRPKGNILIFMGGPYESRTRYDGFPAALALASEKRVFSVSYLGSNQKLNGEDDRTALADLLTSQ